VEKFVTLKAKEGKSNICNDYSKITHNKIFSYGAATANDLIGYVEIYPHISYAYTVSLYCYQIL